MPSRPFPVELPAARATRSPLAFLVSAAAHALVVLVAVTAGRMEIEEVPEGESRRARVQLFELPPMPADPQPVRPPPPEVVRAAPRRIPRPQVVRGAPMPEELTVRPEPAPEPRPDTPPLATAPEPPAASPEPPPPATPPVDLAAARASEMRAEAQRLFGPRRLGSDRPPGPVSATWVSELADNRPNDCTPRQRPPRDPSAAPELGTVSGRVFRAGTSQPLPGAYLQILGTPYGTFADDDGSYSLEFDRSLVDDCRTQYVQVSKDGFAPQRLILSLGSRTSNDIPLQRR